MRTELWIAATTLSAALALNVSARAQCHAGKGQQVGAETAPKSCCAGGVVHKGDAAGKNTECTAAGRVCGGAQCAAPTFTYKVGDDVLSCPHRAEELARKNGGAVRYVVRGVEHADKAEALDAYAVALEEHVKNIGTVLFAVGGRCYAGLADARQRAQQDGLKIRYCVGSYMFDDREAAERAARAAQEAASKVNMTMIVAGQKYGCDKEAAAACARTGQKCEYQVGQCKTDCKMTARCELAKARIEAARQVLAKAAGA